LAEVVQDYGCTYEPVGCSIGRRVFPEEVWNNISAVSQGIVLFRVFSDYFILI
jgi:hypothetical protein